jgi:hypothetical protein
MRSTSVTPLTQKEQVSNRCYCDSLLLVSGTKLKNKLIFFKPSLCPLGDSFLYSWGLIFGQVS